MTFNEAASKYAIRVYNDVAAQDARVGQMDLRHAFLAGAAWQRERWTPAMRVLRTMLNVAGLVEGVKVADELLGESKQDPHAISSKLPNSQSTENANQVSEPKKLEIPFDTFKNPICRGDVLFGSACGACEKCKWLESHRGLK